MFSNFLKHISKYSELDEVPVGILQKYFKSTSYKKKDYLLHEGQICNSIHFVEKGCLRMYFINDRLNEQITQFALENWWISDYFSFANNSPSEYFIQTVEKSEILSIDKNDFEALLKELPEMERYFRIIMQRNVTASQIRLKQMYELSKEEFYLQFCNSFPEFIQRVPQYMIASYLGLTPEYVSELRKKRF